MAGNFHKNSKDGNIPGISLIQGTKTPGGDALLNDYSNRIDTSILGDDISLSKAKGLEGQINWFGSSYSGIDIKVVAHLYSSADITKEYNKIKEQKDVYRAISGGARNLSSAIPGLASTVRALTLYDSMRNAFVAGIGLTGHDDAEKKAIGFLTTELFDLRRMSTIQGTNYLKSKAQKISEDFDSRAAELELRISELENTTGKGTDTVVLGTLQTLSIQTHREKYAVRACGHSYAKGFTRGPRTIAGSMIFTVFNEHSLAALIRAMGGRETIWKNPELSTLLPDQLPPIDITIAFANEYGSLSEQRIFGLEFVNDGMTMSIEDLLTEQVVNFVARDCDIMTDKGKVRLSRLQRGAADDNFVDLSASSLLFNNQRYYEYLDMLGVRRRRFNR